MSISSDAKRIVELLPPPDIDKQEAERRLKKYCNARQLRDMRERLESLSIPVRQKAAEIGPEGMSLFDKAVREFKRYAKHIEAEFGKFNEQVVTWLVDTPEGRQFFERQTA